MSDRLTALTLAFMLLINASSARSRILPAVVTTLQQSATADRDVRERIATVAGDELRRQVGQLSSEQLKPFGFASPDAAARATVARPLGVYAPDRQLDRRGIEASLESPPSTWIVPVIVDRRIVCIVTVATPAGAPPRATAFGKTYLANRLQAVNQLLGGASPAIWDRARFLSYVDPPVDLVLVRAGSTRWRWLQLVGTSDAAVKELADVEIGALVDSLKRLHARGH